MESDIDYVTLLKSISDLKQQVDDLANKHYGHIDNAEITSIRNVIENLLQKYSSRSECNTNQSSQLKVIDFSCDEHFQKSKSKIHTIDDVSSNCCNVINETQENSNNYTERNLNRNTVEYRGVPNNKNNLNKQQKNIHGNCEVKLKFFKTYAKEMECRVKRFRQFMSSEQLNDKHTKEEVKLTDALKQLKDNEYRYRAKVKKLSDELEYERRKSNEHRKRSSSQIEWLKCMAKKHADESKKMAETLSLVAVDLILSDRKSAVGAVLEGGNENSLRDKSNDNEDDDGDIFCTIQESLAGSQSFSCRPVTHSTPWRTVDRNRSCSCSSMAAATGVDWGTTTTDNEDYVDDDDLFYRADAVGRGKGRHVEESNESQRQRRSSKVSFEQLDGDGSMEKMVCEYFKRKKLGLD